MLAYTRYGFHRNMVERKPDLPIWKILALQAIDIRLLYMLSSHPHQEWPENRARQPGMDAQGA